MKNKWNKRLHTPSLPISLYNCYRTVRHEKRYLYIRSSYASLLMPHCPVTVVQRYRDGVCSLLFHLLNPRRACARVTVLVLCVCVYPCVCLFQVQLLQRTFTPAINDSRGFLAGFSWILIRGFSKKPSLQKLWREKANMQMS